MNPASISISTSCARRISSMRASKASRASPFSRWQTAEGMPACSARSSA